MTWLRSLVGPTRWPEVAYLALPLLAFGGIAVVIGAASGALLGIVLVLLGTIPGAALVRRVLPSAGLFVLVVIGSVAGLGLWSVGSMVAHLTGFGLLRWLPTALAFTLWFFPRGEPGTESVRFPVVGVLASAVGTALLLPVLKGVVQQQGPWEGMRELQVDLPFQVALTAESAARAPEVFPWLPAEPLNYTWLFHGAMGTWSAGSGVSAADVVLIAWPVIAAVLLPALIVIATWEMTKSRIAMVAAPGLFILALGPVFVPTELWQVTPIYSVSPTRDFGNLFLLLVVVTVGRLVSSDSAGGRTRRWTFGALVFASFVACGAKSSELPILVGGGLAILVVALITRTSRRLVLGVFSAIAIPGVLSFVLVLPSLGRAEGSNTSLGVQPFSFIEGDLLSRTIALAPPVILLIVAIVGAWVLGLLHGRVLGATFLAGISGAGIVCAAVFSHESSAQVYFWQSAQPAFVILLAWCIAFVPTERRVQTGIAAGAMLLAGNVLALVTQRTYVVVIAVALLAGVAAIVARPWTVQGRHHQLSIVASAAVLAMAAQVVGIPNPPPFSVSVGPSSIDSSQIAGMQVIRDQSDPDELVVSNKHCRIGSRETGDCQPQWFAVAAWSERRVLVEGWGYTPAHADSPSVIDALARSDAFVLSPTRREADELVADGIRWVYIDTTEQYSYELDSVATLVFESEWCRVYRID